MILRGSIGGVVVFLAILMLFPSAVLADAICSAPTCPGFTDVTFPGPLSVPEGIQMLLPAGVTVTAGDVLIYDTATPPPAPTFVGLGDVLRFINSGGGVAHAVILLSDFPIEPEDTGLPASFQANTFLMTEDAGSPTFYTSGGAIYAILSDGSETTEAPEPNTFLAVGGLLAGMWLLRRGRRRT
jgi:hypothetical protein